ncbi:MAG: VTT domain-containing protein [Bryobacterales bacterium]|nr:VTT domain-containing protein [Bryobacterales bacterium]
MIQTLIDFLRTLTDPGKLVHLLSTVVTGWWGYALLFAVVFSETGLLIGFILPGDSLLFTIGVVAGAGQLDLPTICLVLWIAVILGDASGYHLGVQTGMRIFERPDSRFFKKEYVERTQAFYAKHGGKTIVLARFVPIIRTFAPFVAGVAKMGYRRFFPYSVLGGLFWVVSLTWAGYVLGQIPLVRQHFEKFVIGIIVISVAPVIMEAIKSRRRKSETVQVP